MRAFFLFLILPACAWSYPTYIEKGYTNCASCHYNPTGGGLVNSYGFAAQSSTFFNSHNDTMEESKQRLFKRDVTGFKEDGKTSTLQWGVGLDMRALVLVADGGNGEDEGGEGEDGGGSAGQQPYFIPMLLEAGGVLAYGPWMVYGTVTPRRAGESQIPDSAFSREHWVGRKLGDESMIRAGRLVLPFGIRSPDHTLYTREDFGFDKWDQSYALEWDLFTERWMTSIAGFMGDLILDPSELQQRGGVASVSYNFPGKATLGTSLLGSVSDFTSTFQSSLFGRSKFLKNFYVMEELDFKHVNSSESLGTIDELATVFRFGMFPMESLDIYFEAAVRKMFNQGDLDKTRYAFGAQWQILSWMELVPAVTIEQFNSQTEVIPMAQFHMVF